VIPQAARFAQVCRVFAPVYRQTTGQPGGDSSLAYRDVLAAWRDYLAHDNDGRGVVLIGHSEGAFMLERLLQDPTASVRKVLVSALLLGGDVQVGSNERFAGYPACRSNSATGCIVAYSSWSATPPANAGLQAVARSSEHVLCVNPADPASAFGTRAITPIFPWIVPEGLVPGAITPSPPTFWVSFPDMYTARCVREGTRSWLLIKRIPHPGDPRPMVKPIVGASLGLHAADVNIALANLIALVQTQTRAWVAAH
jgi:pimeloyl-ACP methyl ester carboxylesterase